MPVAQLTAPVCGWLSAKLIFLLQVNSLALDNRCMTSRQKLKETPQDMTRAELFTTDEAHLNFKTSSPMATMVDTATLERAVIGPKTASRMTPVSTLPQSAMKGARTPLLTN